MITWPPSLELCVVCKIRAKLPLSRKPSLTYFHKLGGTDSLNPRLTVDLQDGYGDRLREAISKIIDLGAVGCNLEDATVINGSSQLLSISDQVARIRTVMSIASEKGVPNFVLNARTDAVVLGGTVQQAIERGRAYLEAGACTVFVWGSSRGLRDAEVKELVQGLDGRLNVILKKGEGMLSLGALRDIGVARISMGPGLWRAAMATVKIEIENILGT
jgi:2-methylisocitrate lyase-like PEP mutase family enzyme